jgi:hypothetical protein
LGLLGYKPAGDNSSTNLRADDKPTPNSIAVWAGHVAYVENVTTSGTVTYVTFNQANALGYNKGHNFADLYDPIDPENTDTKNGPPVWGGGYDGTYLVRTTAQMMKTVVPGSAFFGYVHLVPPTVAVKTPSSAQHGYVNIGYTLTDADSEACDLLVQYSMDGGATWKKATPGPGGNGTTGLASSPSGSSYTFVWSSGKDILNTQSSQLEISISPTYTAPGAAGTTGTFTVNNTPSPTAGATQVTATENTAFLTSGGKTVIPKFPTATLPLGEASTNGLTTDAALRALWLDDSSVMGKPRPLFEP